MVTDFPKSTKGGLNEPQILKRQQQHRRAPQVAHIGKTLAEEAYTQPGGN